MNNTEIISLLAFVNNKTVKLICEVCSSSNYWKQKAIRTVQLEHSDVGTTQIYTHVIEQGANAVRSPLSDLH